jgi:LPXTG-motif cell wall-anchored protein
MAKRLLVLVGVLAVMLVAAVPAFTQGTSIRGLLPDTGGAAILALIGAGVLLVGGLLIRRLFR